MKASGTAGLLFIIGKYKIQFVVLCLSNLNTVHRLEKSKSTSAWNKKKKNTRSIQKGLSNKLPKPVCEQYEQLQPQTSFRSSNQKVIIVPKHKTEKFKHSPLYRTVNMWNSIPLQIKEIENSATFKRNLQKYLQKDFKMWTTRRPRRDTLPAENMFWQGTNQRPSNWQVPSSAVNFR